jgi:hypothetical protein
VAVAWLGALKMPPKKIEAARALSALFLNDMTYSYESITRDWPGCGRPAKFTCG